MDSIKQKQTPLASLAELLDQDQLFNLEESLLLERGLRVHHLTIELKRSINQNTHANQLNEYLICYATTLHIPPINGVDVTSHALVLLYTKDPVMINPTPSHSFPHYELIFT